MSALLGNPGLIVGSPPASGAAPISEWWWYPAAPDARDVEFENVALPAGFAWWEDNGGAGPLVAHAAVNNVALTMDSSPATFVRYKVHTDRRRSWMECQVPQQGGGGVPYNGKGYYLLRPITLETDVCFWSRMQFPVNWLSGGTGVAGPVGSYIVLGSAAGIPNRDTALMIGFEGQTNTGGNVNGNLFVISGAASAIVPIGSFEFSQGSIPGVGFRRRSSTNWAGIFMSIDFNRTVAEFTQAAIGGTFATFAPTHVGWKFRSNIGQGYNPIFGIDFDRWSTDVNKLPL